MRGFFGGLIVGLVTVVIGAVVLALLSPISLRPEVTDGAPQAATGADVAGQTGPGPDITAPGADADLVELAPTAPAAGPDGRDDLSLLDPADTRPADKPKVGDATAGLGDPGTAPQAPEGVVNRAAPLAPSARPSPGAAPVSPQGERPPETLANPVQPVVPDVSQTGSGFGTGPVGDAQSPEIATHAEPAPDPVPAPVPHPGAAAQDAAPQVALAEPQETQEPKLQPKLPGTVAAPSSPQIAALPQAGPDSGPDSGPASPRIGTPVVPLTQRTDRPPATVPTIGTTSDVTSAIPADPPITAFAEAFDNPDNRPVMAIVLIDGVASFGAEALSQFPYPLSFAVDPSDPDAAAKMARHRAAGFEVVALIDLPDVATARDAEVSLSVWLDTLPQVVALLEGPGSGFQGNRELSDQVTEIALASGLGMVMQSRGLNTAHKLAVRDGVPAALVFRDFDGAEQTPTVMRRFLDQAAFRAGQQGGVIMLGRLRPDTISALLLWGLQDRAGRVALAPVSAVLTREDE